MNRPFCRTPRSRQAFDRWQERLRALGVEAGEADAHIIGLLASREACLEGLQADLAACRDSSLRLRLVAAERLAAGDMAKALDQLERLFGSAAVEKAEVAPTGTDGRVVAFPGPRGLGVVGRRIVAALEAGPLTRVELRRRVSGSQGAFLRGLRDALTTGAIRRSGRGSKGNPYRYEVKP